MKISHSKVELYNQCSMKYRYKYIDKIEINKTYTPLLFGLACDEAFNYILIQKKNNETIDREKAITIFQDKMGTWYGQNELVYFKNEAPEFENNHPEQMQKAVWKNLCNIGEKFIDCYINEILPKFEEIIDVQITKNVKNEEDDILVLVVDFVGKLKDGRVITFDNKTTSDIKKNYNKSSVANSQQLAIYTEYANNRTAGYIALQKKLKDDKVVWNMIVDDIPESKTDEAFNRIDAALVGIKNEEFKKNVKACFSYGKRCEYYAYCHFGNEKDIIKK